MNLRSCIAKNDTAEYDLTRIFDTVQLLGQNLIRAGVGPLEKPARTSKVVGASPV